MTRRPGFGPPRGGYTLEGREARALGVAAAAGRAGHRAGARFEEQLDAGHAKYRDQGLGLVARVGERVVGRPGAVKRVGGAQVDFVGVVRGLAVAFDAKTATGKAKLSMSALAPTLEPRDVRRIARQIGWLLDFERGGGRGWYACYDAEAGAEGTVFLVPANALQPLVDDVTNGAVPLRTLARDGSRRVVDTPWPVVTPSPLAAIARGAPLWDWARVVLGLTGTR